MVQAVLVRGIKRAQRLRFVSKAWDDAIGRAIIESGILDDEIDQVSSVHWPYHLANKALRDKSPVDGGEVSTPLGMIRLIAERVTSYNGLDIDTGALKSTIDAICIMIQTTMGKMGSYLQEGEECYDEIPVGSAQNFYDAYLLGTAAWLNELDLLKETLQSMEDISGSRECNLVHAIGVAAYKGHDEALSLLLSILERPITKKLAIRYSISQASHGNQLSTLEIGLQLGRRVNTSMMRDALFGAASLPIFEKLLPLTDYPRLAYYFSSVKKEFEHLAFKGAIPIMDCIIHLNDLCPGCEEISPKWKGPMRRAVKGGSLETVTYLWNHGFAFDEGTLIVAVEHGNPDVVQFLLEQPATADYPLKSALYEAVRRENDKVVRMLLTKGSARLDERTRENAQREARYRGLESMESLLLEYQAGEQGT